MKRSLWPLYSALVVATFLFVGIGIWRTAVPGPLGPPYDPKTLGLGTEATIVIAMSTTCTSCIESMEAYKRLTALPGMDGKGRRVVAVAMDGVWPLKDLADPLGFKPHRLTSGPYPRTHLPGVSEAGSVLLLDRDGKARGKWVGRLSADMERNIVSALAAL